MSTTDHDDILVLAAQRAAGVRLSSSDQGRLERAMLDDPELALLVLDAQDVTAALTTDAAAQQTPRQTTTRVTLAALVFGLLACFGVGATAGAQLASGLVGGLVGSGTKSSAHQIDVRPIGDSLSLSFDAARKRK